MILEADGVAAGYGDQTVLEDVSIGVDAGEVLTVIGPSGTGKTTLLRLLAAFRPPWSGSVTWNGRDIWALPDDDRLVVRRQLSMVFQEPSLFNAPVHRNVAYGRRIRKPWRERFEDGLAGLVGTGGCPDAVERDLALVGLADERDRNALSLSTGEAQRVAFARALAVDPDVVLLDEPTSNLDPRNTAVLEDAILRARDRGVGVVVATHDMHQAARISDRVGVVLHGELVESGPADRVLEDPTDPRTARFVDGELLYDDSPGPEE